MNPHHLTVIGLGLMTFFFLVVEILCPWMHIIYDECSRFISTVCFAYQGSSFGTRARLRHTKWKYLFPGHCIEIDCTKQLITRNSAISNSPTVWLSRSISIWSWLYINQFTCKNLSHEHEKINCTFWSFFLALFSQMTILLSSFCDLSCVERVCS